MAFNKRLIIFIQIFVQLGLVLSDEDVDTFPNIGYLGRGYDMYYGNPLNTLSGTDPGFRDGIFQFSYDSELTPDQRYKIPAGVDVMGEEACSIAFSSTTVKTGGEYQQSLERNVETSVAADIKEIRAKFAASKDYKNVHKSTSERKNVYIITEGTCSKYEASLLEFIPPNVSKNFQVAVTKYLTTSYDKRKLSKFFKAFGTHVTISLVMGARYGMVSEVDTKQFSSMKQATDSWKTDASLSLKLTFAQKRMTTDEIKLANRFKRITKSQKVYSLGSRPPSDDSATTWAQSAFDNPMPISYKLDRIDTILTPDYFPKMNESELSQKRNHVRRYFEELCEELVKKGEIDTCSPEEPPEPAPSTCRVCKTCTAYGDYSIEVGRRLDNLNGNRYNARYLPPWDMFGEECQGPMTAQTGDWRFCCSPPVPECQFCHSCGGQYPVLGGGRRAVRTGYGDGGYAMGLKEWSKPGPPIRVRQEGCQGSYDAFGGELSLCCQTERHACRLCDACGEGMEEVGRRLGRTPGTGSGRYNVFSSSECTAVDNNATMTIATKFHDYNEVKICCPSTTVH